MQLRCVHEPTLTFPQGLFCCVLSAQKEESRPEIIPQLWGALECALAYLLVLQVLTVHEGHVEPDSVRQLDALLPSRLLRKFIRIAPRCLRVFGAASHEAPVPCTSEKPPLER